LKAKKTSNQNNKTSGFTLIELMITLSIAAILMSVAAPSFTSMIQNNRMTSQANQFIASLTYARSEAIKRGVNIDVTATSGNTNWQGGWTISVSGGDTLKVFAALDGTSTLISDADISPFQYQPSGRASTTATFSLCDGRDGEEGRELQISTTGRISVSKVTCDG